MKFYETRRVKHIQASLSRRLKEWYEDLLDQYQIEELAYRPDADAYAYEVGTVIEIVINAAHFMTAGLDPEDLKDKLEKEVLEPAGFQILDYTVKESGARRVSLEARVTDLRSRSEPVEKPRYLYHVTSKKNEDNIMRKGLTPKAGPRDKNIQFYKNRIYFVVNKWHRWESLVDDKLAGGARPGSSFIVVRVDTRKFDRFSVFQDTEAKYNPDKYVWTPTHIPAYALDVVFDSSE